MIDSNDNSSRLFLYIDLLGFTALIEDREKTDRIFRILDNANLHRDSNYQAIAFSDTLLVYNIYTKLSRAAKTVEFMYLVELAQDLQQRLTGENIFFRGIITEGEFNVNGLKNIQAYYGKALIESYSDEKKLVGIGLFADNKLRPLNDIFRYKEFSEKYDFIYMTQNLTRHEFFGGNHIKWISYENEQLPIPSDLLCDAGLEYLIYPEIIHLREVYTNTLTQRDPAIRAKYLNTWRMYELAYPEFSRVISNNDFDLSMISVLDWKDCIRVFNENKEYYSTPNKE